MTKIFTIVSLLALGTLSFARPTSNVINAVYSLQDDFFEAYDLPAISFKDRVHIIESFNTVVYDSSMVGAGMLQDGLTLWVFSETEGKDEVHNLYFRLIKDKKQKRHLLFVFKQLTSNGVHLERVDVLQYDKKAKNRWKTIDGSNVIPKLTWNDLYDGISENALEQIFTMRPAVELMFLNDGTIHASIASDYIEMELTEVNNYLNNNPVDAKYILYTWSKANSRFKVSIE